MTTFTAVGKIETRSTEERSPSTDASRGRWTAGLLCSILLACVSALSGLWVGVLTISAALVPTTGVYATATVLIGAAFVFLGLAAHCLDRMDSANRKIRLDYCRRHGLREESDSSEEASVRR